MRAVILCTILTVTTAVTFTACQRRQPAAPASEAQRSRVDTPPVRQSGIESYADVVDRVASSVVTIRSARRVRAPQQFPFFNDPFFRRFFGQRFGNEAPEAQDRVERGLGSGVVVRDDGHLLTNHHVIDGAQEIRVEFIDGRSFEAKLVGSDPPSDLAVLKINGSGLRALRLGNSDSVRVGDVVLAVGNPLGIGQTVTSGIISAKGRTTGMSDGSFEDFLQTDAPINRGNSGGALVNTAGELIGINSQILSPTGGNIGIGFAIPSNMAHAVMEQLVKNGEVRRGQLGVTIQPLTPELAQAFNIKDGHGVMVGDVQQGSPAERAGIQRGDVITAVNGQATETPNQLRNRVSSMEPGTDATITALRNGQERQFKVKLGALRMTGERGRQSDSAAPSGGKLGLAVQPLTADIARQLGLSGVSSGLVVSDVDPMSPAAEAGIVPGDVIVQANRQPVRQTADLEQAASSSKDKPLLLLVNRRGQTFFTSVTVH